MAGETAAEEMTEMNNTSEDTERLIRHDGGQVSITLLLTYIFP